MARPKSDESEAIGNDSFLDVVTNIVGILIVLVMVAGIRARSIPPDTAIVAQATQKATVKLNSLTAKEQKVEGELLGISSEMRELEELARLKERARRDVALDLSLREKELARFEEEMLESKQSAYDLQQRLNDALRDLDLTQKGLEEVESQGEENVVERRSYPTPLSQVVTGGELHFRLDQGKIAFVPLDELVTRVREDVHKQASRLSGSSSTVSVVGPINGFRLKYELRKLNVAQYVGQSTMQVGTFAQVTQIQIEPVIDGIGETVADAMKKNSRFRAYLADANPRNSTVTIWTYPDGFSDFTRLKEALYHAGYSVAARPLPDGMPIVGSPGGSKSLGQ